MAQIRIAEADYTGGVTESSTETGVVIRIPGASYEQGMDTGLGGGTGFNIILVTADNYQNIIATDGVKNTVEASLISKLYSAGAKVYIIKSWLGAADYLKDRNQLDVKFLLCNEDDTKETSADSSDAGSALKNAVAIAAERRDCAVVYGKTKSTYATGTGEAEECLTDTLASYSDDMEETGTNGKYVIPVYANSLKSGGTSVNPEYAWITAYLYSIAKGNAEWLAIAGASRGESSMTLSCGPITESTVISMQPSDSGRAINPIINSNPWGVRIWGARTAEAIDSTEGIKGSHFANIRVLLCDIKKRLYTASKKYQFEQNNDVLWVQYKSYVNTLLDEMQSTYGIAGYKWTKITDNVPGNKLKCKLEITPVEPVDDFDINIKLTDEISTVSE